MVINIKTFRDFLGIKNIVKPKIKYEIISLEMDQDRVLRPVAVFGSLQAASLRPQPSRKS